jgi:hypothetical protein
MKRFSQYITEEDLELGKGEVVKSKDETEETETKKMKFGKGKVVDAKNEKVLKDKPE